MVSIQSDSKQDFFVYGHVGDMRYLGVMDGHGRNACIDYVRTLDFDYIASQPDPAQTLWDFVQSGGNFYKSGCTFTFARITHLIEVWNVGDSETHVFVNDLHFRTILHNFHNHDEVLRTKSKCFIRQTTAPKLVSDEHIQDLPSFTGYFFTGDALVPSQSMGHNGATGFAPHKQVIHYNPIDRVRIVCVTDGVSDMHVDLAHGSALDIANEALRKWKQPWHYKGFHGIRFQNIDDISCVLWENKVELPSICIPYAPSLFTQQDVREVFQHLAHIRKIDEVGKQHKVFFIHFNPGILHPTMRNIYAQLEQDKHVKIWVRKHWFWYIRTNQRVRNVGWQYELWDGTGDYFDFAKDLIDANTCLRIFAFLMAF